VTGGAIRWKDLGAIAKVCDASRKWGTGKREIAAIQLRIFSAKTGNVANQYAGAEKQKPSHKAGFSE